MSALTTNEKTRLAELESTIRGGLNTFVEVGNALNEISDSRLYRETHGSFAEYVEAVWNLERSRAYQMMDAAKVVENFRHSDVQPPQTESQARELRLLPPAEQAEAYQSVVESTGGNPTAKAVREEVQRRTDRTSGTDRTDKTTTIKPITEARFESVVEKEMTRISELMEQFPNHVDVIEENLRYLLGRCEEIKQAQVAA